jgi:hypothetical protein
MSLGVSRFGPGIGIAPIRIAPSSAAYHSGIRGSITNTWSPLPTPRSNSARAALREARARSAADCSATTFPTAFTDSTASASGSSEAQASTMASTALKRSGTSMR